MIRDHTRSSEIPNRLDNPGLGGRPPTPLFLDSLRSFTELVEEPEGVRETLFQNLKKSLRNLFHMMRDHTSSREIPHRLDNPGSGGSPPNPYSRSL